MRPEALTAGKSNCEQEWFASFDDIQFVFRNSQSIKFLNDQNA
jgi:hypothetical protein